MSKSRSLAVLGLALAPPAFAQAPMAPLVGTVLDPAGKPVPGADVRVSRCDGRLFHCLDLALRNEWVEIARTRSDKTGRFGTQLPLGLALRVEVDVPPYARWVSDSIVPGENQTVRLEAACTLAGRIVNAATGKGTPCALRAWNPMTNVELFAGRTDADGGFRFERLPSGPFRCDLDPEVAMRPMWNDYLLAVGEQRTVEWRCEAGVELTGTVTDAETGEPIAGARIGEGWTFDKAVRSGARGSYTMRGFGSADGPGGPGVIDAYADAPGYAVVREDVAGPFTADHKLDLALTRGVRVAGRVTDGDGKPIANAYVAAIGATDMNISWRPCRTDADGAFVCDGFPRRTEGVLMVRCAGFASVVYYLPRPAGDGQIDFGTVKLRAPQVVRGFVRDADGTPLAGVEVTRRGTNADVGWLGAVPASWWLLRTYAGECQVRTDANGAFAFGDVAPGDYALVLASTSDPNPPSVDVTVVAGAEQKPITLTR